MSPQNCRTCHPKNRVEYTLIKKLGRGFETCFPCPGSLHPGVE